jgi:hypothetical protein
VLEQRPVFFFGQVKRCLGLFAFGDVADETLKDLLPANFDNAAADLDGHVAAIFVLMGMLKSDTASFA